MFYITRDSVQYGPYILEKVNELLASGELVPADRAWWQGCVGWQTVAQIPGVVLPGAVVAPAAAPASLAEPASAWAPRSSLSAAAAEAPVVDTTTDGTAAMYAPSKAMARLDHTAGASDQVAGSTVEFLRQTRPWVLFLSIMGMISLGLVLLSLVFVAFNAPSRVRRVSGLVDVMLPVLALLLFYSYPIIKLFKYARAITRLTQRQIVQNLDAALSEQKSFWKFIGVIVLLGVVVYVASIIFVGAAVWTGLRTR